jgi:hypothetical protein
VPGESDGHGERHRRVSGGEGKDVRVLGQCGEAADSGARARTFADPLQSLRKGGGDDRCRTQQQAIRSRWASGGEKNQAHQNEARSISKSSEYSHQQGEARKMPATHLEEQSFVAPPIILTSGGK